MKYPVFGGRARFELDQRADPRVGRPEAAFLEAVGPRAYQYGIGENLPDPFESYDIVKARLALSGYRTPRGQCVPSMIGLFYECGAGVDEPLD
jgi:hypothetical protein